MMSAVIAVEGPLGDAVALTLERATPAWKARRASGAGDSRPDVVIVDEGVDEGEHRVLASTWNAPLLVLGRDIDKPFTVATLRAKALFTARPVADDGLVAIDRPLRAALEILDVAAARRGGVLISGPTGVGKERLAHLVHERSGRRGAFVAVNCAAFNESLVESALFGHVRGAFTGASASVPGALLESDGGTLFLDEVGELDPRIQAKLLRVIEDHRVRALGATADRRVDVRVVAATNRDLGVEMAEGRFRPDLYYRLATFVVYVPPLRERQRDLAALIDLFAARHDRGREVWLGPKSREALLAYPWPGNVRELGNIVERTLALAPGGELSLEALHRLAPELAHRGNAQQRACVERVQKGDLTKRDAATELGVHRTTLWRKMKRMKGNQ